MLALNAIALTLTAFNPTEHSGQHMIMHCSIILLCQIAMEKK